MGLVSFSKKGEMSLETFFVKGDHRIRQKDLVQKHNLAENGTRDYKLIMSTHWGGGHIIFAFSAVCRPASRRPASHLVSRHFRQYFLSYLYQIWHAGLLG